MRIRVGRKSSRVSDGWTGSALGALTIYAKSLQCFTLRTAPVILGLVVLALYPAAGAYAHGEGRTLMDRRHIALSEWWQTVDDRMIVDVRNNMGYLVKRTGQYTSFKVVTGRRSVVRYIGRTYVASTPLKEWVARPAEIKDDLTTFGPRGIFYRLFSDGGDERTAYGIHSHRSAEEMLARNERFASMGCVIVAENIVDVIGKTIYMNGGGLQVVTVNGFAPYLLNESMASAARGT